MEKVGHSISFSIDFTATYSQYKVLEVTEELLQELESGDDTYPPFSIIFFLSFIFYLFSIFLLKMNK